MRREEFYINAPAPTGADAGAYDRAMDADAIADLALAQPGVAAAARAYGPDWQTQVRAFAREAVARLRPLAMQSMDAFVRLQKFVTKHLDSASLTSDKALRAVFGVAVFVVVWAIRITSPITTRLLGNALKAAIPAVLAAAGLETAALPFGLSDPRAKTDVAPLEAAALARVRAGLRDMPFYWFRYRDGAASPDDHLAHLGMMADEIQRRFGVGDGHAVPIMDLLAVLAIAQRGTERDLSDMRRQMDALTRQVVALSRARGFGDGPDGTVVVSGWHAPPDAVAATFPGLADAAGAVAFGCRGHACVLVWADGAQTALVGARGTRAVRIYRIALRPVGAGRVHLAAGPAECDGAQMRALLRTTVRGGRGHSTLVIARD